MGLLIQTISSDNGQQRVGDERVNQLRQGPGLSLVPGSSGLSEKLSVRLRTDPAGVVQVPARATTTIAIHVGRSVLVDCSRGGLNHRGLSVHGYSDIIPAGTPSRWEMKESDTVLLLNVAQSLLRTVAEECGHDSRRIEILNRFQTRDTKIEHVGWALKAEMETGYPNGRLYVESLAQALAIHLLNRHSSQSHEVSSPKGGIPGRRLKQVLSYIEDNLGQDLSLQSIAEVSGLSASYFKTAFRTSVGHPVHQYVIQRRVERARSLLSEGELPISQVALETGFAHQSHLAYHMRRQLGVTPKSILCKDRK
jgi:AraC family transcriptional regulator